MYGDRRKYLTALVVPDFEELEKYAGENKIAFRSREDLARDSRIYDFIKDRIKESTEELANYEKIKNFVLLPREFSQEKEELTPTLKIRRKVVTEKYRNLIEKMYET